MNMNFNMNMKFKLPRNIISNNVLKYILYLITLALAVSYIINEENTALISLVLIAGGIYAVNKNIVIALLISIISTNLLVAMNYFKNIDVLEGIQSGSNCCTGQPFYTSNLLVYNTLNNNIRNRSTCLAIERDISAHIATIANDRSQLRSFFNALYDNNDYVNAKRICNTMNLSGSIYDMKGSLFKKSNVTSNVIDDPNILPKDILDLIATSNIKSILSESNKVILDQTIIIPLERLNSFLFEKSRDINIQRPIIISDLTTQDREELRNVITKLKLLYTSSNIDLLTKIDTTYTLYNNNNQPIGIGTQYTLTKDQYLDCSGVINNTNIGTFSRANILELSNNDYFGTSGIPVSRGGLGDASYNPYGTIAQSDLYPSNRDLEMELRRLETIPSSGNAPVNIISTYLSAINTFYEKQIQNLTNSKSTTFSQPPINDIYSIRTVKPTFFTYDNTYNNQYQCQDSITGNSAFKYCGPSAYYEIPKF